MQSSKILKVTNENLKNEISNLDSDLILLVVDSEIQKQYPDFMKGLQKIKDKRVLSFVSASGERAKTFEEYENGMNFFLEKNVHRNAHLVAIGGGAVTDLGGFIASTLLRGIKWSNVPTTLLAMVDAAIGGKTAINSKYGKNLIGSFHLPYNIWINTEFLKTLSDTDYNCGVGEIIKYGMINRDIYQSVSQKKEIEEIISNCAEFKNSIVTNDFKELGIRQVLNYGHTFGHAIEKHYQISHGESVFWGMYLIGFLFETERDLQNLIFLNSMFDNPFNKPPWLNKTIPVQNFLDYIKKDKKKVDDKNLNLVLSVDGSGEIKKFSFKDVESIFNNRIDELKKIEIKNN
jgi:3-dehydroquinate synthase